MGLGTAVLALALTATGPATVSQLAYVRPDGIYVGTRRVLRHGFDPAWSPDGAKLAFASRIGRRHAEIFVADADGSHVVRVTRGAADATAPAWAPDGRRLAFARRGTISIVRVDGHGEHPVARGDDPAWSPDGKRIAYERGENVYVRALAGGREVTHGVGRDPAYGPRGRLAYVSSDDGVVWDVPVAPDQLEAASPTWSPDARRLAFSDRGVLWVANAAADDAPDVVGRGTSPSWRPTPPRVRELLPDLDQRAPAGLRLSWSRGRWLLGFASAVDNVGDGPVQVTGFRPNRSTPTMRAHQRVRLAGGGARLYRDVGLMRYVRDGHEHWHFLPFEHYELRRARDFSLVVRDRKSGFCLADHYGHARGFLRYRVRRPVFLGNCSGGNPAAMHVEQGNSVGYTDRYPAHYHGQNVDVTGVRPGLYVLVHRASPRLLLREKRYTNNAASLLIRLTWPNGRRSAPAVRVLRTCESTERCPAT